jgi:hypothetical protein
MTKDYDSYHSEPIGLFYTEDEAFHCKNTEKLKARRDDLDHTVWKHTEENGFEEIYHSKEELENIGKRLRRKYGDKK